MTEIIVEKLKLLSLTSLKCFLILILRDQERNGVLRIVDIRLEDRGPYTCTAVNTYGRGFVTVVVDVERE